MTGPAEENDARGGASPAAEMSRGGAAGDAGREKGNVERGARWVVWAALGVIFLAGAALRAPELEEAPPGLWFDEALNANAAVATAQTGDWKIVYPDVFPREPGLIWPLAAMAMVNDSLPALRSVSAAIGLATIVLLYFMLRSFTDEATALFGVAALAALQWHAILSRLLFRSLTLPLVACAIVWAAGAARRRPGGASGAVFGALVGAGFYTYLAWYFMLPGVAALYAWIGWGAWRDRARAWTLGAAVAAALVVAAPILIAYAREPGLLLDRPRAVAPGAESDGSAWAEIGEQAIEALGMFHVRGDTIGKFNLPGQPALDPILGIAFAVGIAVCIVRVVRRRSALEAILLGWLALGILPTVFSSTEAPHFLRTLVATPAVAGIAGIGFAAVWKGITRLNNSAAMRWGAGLAVAGLVAVSFGWAAQNIYVKWAPSQETWDHFNGGQTQIGQAAGTAPEGVTVWVPQHLREHPTVQFFAPDREQVRGYARFEDFLGSPADADRPRWVVATNHNMVFPVLEYLVPEGRVVEVFQRPAGESWALMYEIPAGSRIPQATIEMADRQHPVKDLRW